MNNDERTELQRKERLGMTKCNIKGEKMIITKYVDAKDIVVKFENGFERHTTYDNFKKGKVSNPYFLSVWGIGYLGEGIKGSSNNKVSKSYHHWNSMLKRCYDYKFTNKVTTYKSCKTYEEWHNYQNFIEWFDYNYYEIEGEIMCLDKDILFKNNKIYSPETCVFVPQTINALFIRKENHRGKYPIGVTFHKDSKKFYAHCSRGNNTTEFLGSFNTTEEAFYSYKQAKESYIKEVADLYKDKIPAKLYDAMYKYEVEITD